MLGGLCGEGNETMPIDPRGAVRSLRRADPKLAALIDRVGEFRLEVEALQSPFVALLEAIVYQQLTGKAAATILSRVNALFRPRRGPAPDQILAAPEALLRGAGLSRGKVAALKDLAAGTLDGTVPPAAALRRMGEEEIVERLTAVRGVGRWTVEMLLIFRLGRPDVLPATDYGIRKGFARAFGGPLPPPARVLRRGERWRPYRTVASWYLWRALDSNP
jgi:3-methyladenine DNA glycosylase/8-oxoguanine DNA glycosylase